METWQKRKAQADYPKHICCMTHFTALIICATGLYYDSFLECFSSLLVTALLTGWTLHLNNFHGQNFFTLSHCYFWVQAENCLSLSGQIEPWIVCQLSHPYSSECRMYLQRHHNMQMDALEGSSQVIACFVLLKDIPLVVKSWSLSFVVMHTCAQNNKRVMCVWHCSL